MNINNMPIDHIKDALTQEEKDWYLNNLFIK